LTTEDSGIFARFNRPKSLTVLDIRTYSWNEQLSMVCTQGLINRKEPRIYLVFDDYVDRLWLPIYRKRYGVKYKEAQNLFGLIRLFADELDGFVVYDDKVLHSANVAMTYGSIHNAVPASPTVADGLSGTGLKKINDFRGKWRDRFEAYEWELENLMPQCSRRIVGSMCVDRPCVVNDQANRHHVRDYLAAVKAFSFDLSTKMRDRREVDLFDRILRSFPSLGVVLGWHCCRDLEIEAVARAAKNGFFVLCNLSSPNLTVHSGIKTRWKFRQRHAAKSAITLENKVYITFVQSDGDAIWAMNNFQNRNWLDSQRGKFPYTWEVQPIMVDLGPGMLEHYYRTATSNDYFIAGPSGAGYTAPTVNKWQNEFLEQTRKYLEVCDLRSALVMNRDRRVGYQELDDPGLPLAIINKIRSCFGFLHGYVGSGFEPTVFVDNIPYAHTSLYVSGSSDVLKEVERFGKGSRTRPLFVSVHVREDAKMPTLKGAIDKLDPRIYEVVTLDEFLLTLQKAKKEGLYREAFPEKEFLRESLSEQGRAHWENHLRRVARLEKTVDLEPDHMLNEFNAGMYDFTREHLADLLGYEAIEVMLYLVQSALNMRGIYVNNLRRSVEDFLKEYQDLPDSKTVKDAHGLWRDWEHAKYDLDDMRQLTRKVIKLARLLEKQLFPQQ